MECGEGGHLIRDLCGGSLLAANLLFLSGEDKVDHTHQVGFELRLVLGVSPGDVASPLVAFGIPIKVSRPRDQDVVNEDCWVSVHPKALCQR